ncbi:MAG: hypothetical protein WAO02_18440 [Verrucomicrobiia bacterium]
MRTIKTYILVVIAFGTAFGLQMPAKAQLWTWTQSTNAPALAWWAVASSADGTRLAAVVRNGGIYTSTNSGFTWISNSAPVRNWWAVASSADGTKLAAVINTLSSVGNGGVYTNNGLTWNITSAPAYIQSWQSIASSSNGMNLVASSSVAPNTGRIYTSTDAGNTWNLTPPIFLQWNGVACSADGTKLVATPYTNSIYTSPDAGATWTTNALPISPSAYSGYSWSVASSADGTKLVTGGISPSVRSIFTSSDSGTTWVSNNAPNGAWYSVAASADGTILAAASPTIICTSTNFGQNWVSNNVPSHTWVSVAMSADASKMVALGYDGFIYTAQLTPPSLNASLSGTNLTIAWPGYATNYQLQQNPTLSGNLWTAATYPITPSNGQNEIVVPATNRQTFFRLQSK